MLQSASFDEKGVEEGGGGGGGGGGGERRCYLEHRNLKFRSSDCQKS